MVASVLLSPKGRACVKREKKERKRWRINKQRDGTKEGNRIKVEEEEECID